MVRLGDVCTFYSGTGFPNIYQGKADGKYPFYKVGDISRNVLSGNRELKICENYIDDDEDEDELDEDYDYEDEEETEQDSDEAFINGGDDTESVDTDENDNEDNNNENDEEDGEE